MTTIANISTSSDFSKVNSTLAALIPLLHEPYQAAVIAALDMPSHVDRIVQALEPTYAAVIQDSTLTGIDLTKVATTAGQLGYWVAFNQWHGKGNRGSEINAAMNSIVSGVAPGALVNAPTVDSQFAPPTLSQQAANVLLQGGVS